MGCSDDARIIQYCIVRDSSAQRSVVLHAPNVHIGGGLVLLQALMSASNFAARWMQCDARAKSKLPVYGSISYVSPNILSRLGAEWRLAKHSLDNDTILCFHNLPPLLRCRGKVVVYMQNRLLTGGDLSSFPLRTRVRIMLERLWLRRCKHHATHYLVQTPQMQSELRRVLGEAVIDVAPFVPAHQAAESSVKQYDFAYVASGEAHKNHDTLLTAWQLLADAGQHPTLAVTVDPAYYPALAVRLEQAKARGLKISNLATTPAAKIYPVARALIYPSLSESFGLPLIEGSRHGLPILAADLPYVREAIDPVLTFDASSPQSIRDAVLVYLSAPKPATPARPWATAETFLAGL